MVRIVHRPALPVEPVYVCPMIALRMEPGVVKSWDAFMQEAPPFSIAVDGYVSAGPRFDAKGPRLNLNHHEEVDRLATRSTSGQALMTVRQGLFTRFRDVDGSCATVYANDCDEDVCTAVFVLRHHYLAVGSMNPALNRLVALEDALDCTAGAYPFPADLPALQELAWIFAPYRQFRMSGGLERQQPDAYAGVVFDVHHRIGKYVAGQGERIPLDTRYERLRSGTGYTVVKEIGAHARTAMFADGIQAYLSVRERGDGRLHCVIGRLSPFVFVDTSLIADALNRVEDLTTSDRWGGGSSIIGSPRIAGSALSLDRIVEVIEEIVRTA